MAAVVQLQTCEVAPAQEVNRLEKSNVITPVAKKHKIAEPVLQDYAWQGFYAGGSIGYGAGSSTQSYDRNANHGLATIHPDGVAFSATGGYNHMISNNFMAGIETDLGIMALSTKTHTIYDGHRWKAKYGPFWGTVRGRMGYTHNDWLFFGTGGLAFMQTDSVSIGNTAPETAKDKRFRTGWVLGAGVEYAFADNLTGKLEYLHMDYGKYSSRSANNEDFYFKDKVELVRVGVNYHF